MPPQAALHLPWGFRDAKRWLLAQAIVGEFFQGVPALCVIGCSSHSSRSLVARGRQSGWSAAATALNLLPSSACGLQGAVRSRAAAAGAGGLIFGWNALALTLKAQGNYSAGCGDAAAGGPCAPCQRQAAKWPGTKFARTHRT